MPGRSRTDARPPSRTRRLRAALARQPLEWSLTIAAGFLSALVLAATVGLRVTTTPPGRVPPGVVVAGIHVGGLTDAEAEQAVRARAGTPPVLLDVRLPDASGILLRLNAADLRPAPRARLAVQRAMARAPMIERIRRELGLGGHRHVSLDYRLEPARLALAVRQIARRIDRPPQSARIRVRNRRIVVSPGRHGRRVDREELTRRVRLLPREVLVPVSDVPPRVSTYEADLAAARAARIVSGPVVVSGGSHEVTLGRRLLWRALRFPVEAGRIDARLAPEVIARGVAPAVQGLAQPPRSASFRVTGRRVEVTPSAPGRTLDAARLARSIEHRTGRDVRLQLKPVAPGAAPRTRSA